MCLDWGLEYQHSPSFSQLWKDIQGLVETWPSGVQICKEKIYQDGRLCVPESLVLKVVEDFHDCNGHIGQRRMAQGLQHHFRFAIGFSLDIIKQVRQNCLTCQGCDKPYWQAKGPIECHPIPERVFTSVCLDVFAMPDVEWDDQKFDCILLCVDRLSGWIVAQPTLKLGLTAKKAAHLMLDSGWNICWVPTSITTDMGAQFVGKWWRTLCARLVVRQAFSQAIGLKLMGGQKELENN